MHHSFDVDIATEYGVLEAILLNAISFWVQRNAANGTNLHDGHFWTYNTTKAFGKMFPYVSEAKIWRALNHLETEGIIIKGNFNRLQYDRTSWYTLSDNGVALTNPLKQPFFTSEKWILQNKEMDFAPVKNGFCTSEEPIPVNTTVSTTVNNTVKGKAFTPPTLEDVTAYCRERGNKVDPQKWLDHYTANGFMVGRTKMRDWKAAVRTWERNGYDKGGKPDYIRADGSEDLMQKWGVS